MFTRGADGWAKNQLGERRLGELFFWATDDWATTVISEKTFRRKTVGRQRPKQSAFLLVL